VTATLLQLVQDTATLLSLPPPSVVVGSTDPTTNLLLALANEEGREISKGFDWQAITFQQEFTTVAAYEQPNAVPTDWLRFISDSFFERTTRRQMWGPITPQAWQALQAYPQITQVFLSWRRRDNKFLIYPLPTAGDDCAYEYVSMNWVEAANGDLKPSFTADTDTAVLPENLFRMGMRWRFEKSKRLDYSEDFRTYQQQLAIEQAQDAAGGKINITGRSVFNSFGFPNLPLGNWPTA